MYAVVAAVSSSRESSTRTDGCKHWFRNREICARTVEQVVAVVVGVARRETNTPMVAMVAINHSNIGARRDRTCVLELLQFELRICVFFLQFISFAPVCDEVALIFFGTRWV